MTGRPPSASRRVLVLGGAGYIGSHVVLALIADGQQVTVLDNLSTGFRSAVPPQAEFYQADIGDEMFLSNILALGQYDAIMHFAGSLIVPESVADPLKYYENNTSNSVAVIKAAVAAGVPNFVFSSTAAVYGVPEVIPISEQSDTRPMNPYGASKLMIERILTDTSAVHPLRFAALRYFNVAGADPDGRTGQSTVGATHLIKVVAEQLTGRRPVVEIFGSDFDTADGTCIRDYIHVSDLADVHVRALDHLLSGGDNLIANCGYGHGFSVREVIAAAEKVSGRRVKTKEAPRRAGDPAELVADATLVRKVLGWRPRFDDLGVIIADALRWEEGLSAPAAGVSRVAEINTVGAPLEPFLIRHPLPHVATPAPEPGIAPARITLIP